MQHPEHRNTAYAASLTFGIERAVLSANEALTTQLHIAHTVASAVKEVRAREQPLAAPLVEAAVLQSFYYKHTTIDEFTPDDLAAYLIGGSENANGIEATVPAHNPVVLRRHAKRRGVPLLVRLECPRVIKQRAALYGRLGDLTINHLVQPPQTFGLLLGSILHSNDTDRTKILQETQHLFSGLTPAQRTIRLRYAAVQHIPPVSA